MKNNGGMSLVEVLVALVIVFIVFLGLSGGGLFVLDQNIKNTQRDEAVSVAEMEMQKVRNTPFAAILDNTHHVFRPVRGLNVDYTVTRTVQVLDAPNKQVTINVGWTRWENKQLKPYNHQVLTIVRSR